MMQEVGIENSMDTLEPIWAEVVNPIGCADCHNPETMDLQ